MIDNGYKKTPHKKKASRGKIKIVCKAVFSDNEFIEYTHGYYKNMKTAKEALKTLNNKKYYFFERTYYIDEKKCPECNNTGIIRRKYFNGHTVTNCKCDKGKEMAKEKSLRPCWIPD